MTKLYIISGISGAGKSQTLKIFEDFGFKCIDNMPIIMFKSFLNVCLNDTYKYKKVAVSIDSRAGKDLSHFRDILIILKQLKIRYRIIFLNASDKILLRRYSETRRRHPSGKDISLGISIERKLLNEVFKVSDEVVDTSALTIGELKKTISVIAKIEQSGKQYLNISVMSFGYKYGAPSDADIIYDVRFIKNPNYLYELKYKTGQNKAVVNYVANQREFKTFFSLFSKLILFTLPHYMKEGKSYLTIAIGCTGGKHRSVFVAEQLTSLLKDQKYKVKLNHRDILQK